MLGMGLGYRSVGSLRRGDDDVGIVVVIAIIPGVLETDAVIRAAANAAATIRGFTTREDEQSQRKNSG
jgi:hypothetical protein